MSSSVAAAASHDERQQQFFTSCMELLLSAGYFRARLPSVTPFDKVLGGLAWCITGSNQEVGVDVVFSDHSTMGQKIKLGENVCAALKAMRCPHPLLSHQIRGGDYESIFPVLQWLVKTLLETRAETLEATRRASESHFTRSFAAAPVVQAMQPSAETRAVVLRALDALRPQRKFRRRSDAASNAGKTEAELVESALAEFGRLTLRSRAAAGAGDKGGQPRKGIAAQLDKEAADKAEAARKAEEKRVASLMGQMDSVDGESQVVSTRVAGGLVTAQSDEIQQAADEYESRQTEREGQGGRGAEDTHRRTVAGLQKKQDALAEQMRKLRDEEDQVDAALAERRARLDAIAQRLAQLEADMQAMSEAETEENAPALAKLRMMIMLNEQLKAQEAAFKASCKQQRDDLQRRIQELSSGSAADEAEEVARVRALLDEDLAKMRKLRQLLARKTREAAALQRKVEEIPSRAELSQYERRFVELYDQVASRLEETRTYYDTYNTLSDTHTFLAKEVSLLNSLTDQFQTLHNKKGREQIAASMAAIIAGIDKMLERQEGKVSGWQADMDARSSAHSELVEKERLFFKATKEFQDECRLNEQLRGK